MFFKTTWPVQPPCVAAKTTDFDDDVLCPVKYLCFACQTKSYCLSQCQSLHFTISILMGNAIPACLR